MRRLVPIGIVLLPLFGQARLSGTGSHGKPPSRPDPYQRLTSADEQKPIRDFLLEFEESLRSGDSSKLIAYLDDSIASEFIRQAQREKLELDNEYYEFMGTRKSPDTKVIGVLGNGLLLRNGLEKWNNDVVFHVLATKGTYRISCMEFDSVTGAPHFLPAPKHEGKMIFSRIWEIITGDFEPPNYKDPSNQGCQSYYPPLAVSEQ